MSEKSKVYVIALFAGLCAASIYFFVPFFPYGYDSVNYIEQARSFIERGVFETIPITLESPENVAVPDHLFPPGYPLLIVISSKLLFIPAEVTAPFLSLAALAAVAGSYRIFLSPDHRTLAFSLYCLTCYLNADDSLLRLDRLYRYYLAVAGHFFCQPAIGYQQQSLLMVLFRSFNGIFLPA